MAAEVATPVVVAQEVDNVPSKLLLLDYKGPLGRRGRRDAIVLRRELDERIGLLGMLRGHGLAHARQRRAHDRLQPSKEGVQITVCQQPGAFLHKLVLQLARITSADARVEFFERRREAIGESVDA